MKSKLMFIITILLLIACENKTSSDSEKDNDSSDRLNARLKVLIASNSSNDNNHASSLWGSMMPNYDFKTMKYDTIKSTDIDSFDVIVLFENGNNSWTTRAGDTIASYVLNGGNVILGTFYGQGRTNTKYTNTNYGAIEDFDPVSGHVNAYTNDTFISTSNHPLLDGIDTLTSHYGGGDTLLNVNATLIANWENGDILAAYTEPAGRILYLSLWPGETSGWLNPGDKDINSLEQFVRLWANAIRYAYAKDTNPDDFNYVPPVQPKNYQIKDYRLNSRNNGSGAKIK